MRDLKGLILAGLAAVILLSPNTLGQTPRAATAVATVVNGFVVAITVTDGGLGYTAAPSVQISGAGGFGALAVATVSNGSVDKITVTEVGSGYGASPSVIISAPPTTRTAAAKATVINGFVVSISVTDGGFGYTFPPIVTVGGGPGTGVEAVATVSNGAVDQIMIRNAGSGYLPTTEVTIPPPAAPVSPFSEGLVAYYPFNGNGEDESGNGNHGAVMDASFSNDRFGGSGKALLLPGYGYLFVNNTPSTEALGLLTVAAWIKYDRLGSGPNGISIASKVSDDGSASAWSFSIAPTGKLRLCANVGGWSYFDCKTALQAGVWHYVAMAYNGSQLMGFVNGQLDGMSNLSGRIASSNRPMRIGAYSPTLGPDEWMFFAGQIDDVRIYSRALSDQEINDLYHYEAPEGPWLAMAIKTVQVTLHVKPNKKYELEASLDAVKWTIVGEPFVATSSKIVQEFSVSEVGRLFRLTEVK